MKKLLIILTFVSWLTPSIYCYAADSGENLFFSLKANLWFQGVDQDDLSPASKKQLGESSSQPIDNKQVSPSSALPEELLVALKIL
ncbi:MAG: hypothetical protein KAG61_03750 [Bacteriovoracaceae bacterium]|nr:hypothetical protein [Bacteriovoracaceae bacterium]